ncbi:DgyrCDS5602 [Dimorphilus gyrociliatus]|uniref:DgyrCDS5602 n=1 Tax=Dimorphilus gyrociliatus TaxID=2664684 RepID=A0A7I8VKG4_9ANNE|nr:DgyrCDS5602 [Dimorphilus gyrociliatus]
MYNGGLFCLILTVLIAASLAIDTFQSSTKNTFTANLAIDGSGDTCAETGFEAYPWLTVDYNTNVTISSLTILGRNIPHLRVRIGDELENLEYRKGFKYNPICASPRLPPYTNEITVNCGTTRTGRYLTIESTDMELTSLNICNIKLNTA